MSIYVFVLTLMIISIEPYQAVIHPLKFNGTNDMQEFLFSLFGCFQRFLFFQARYEFCFLFFCKDKKIRLSLFFIFYDIGK